jgi:hypothetical protein
MTGKSILFISPIFHDYHLHIIKQLEKLGANVYFFPERDYSFKFKIINNFFNHNMIEYQKLHYTKILKNTENVSFDYLFVIRGYMIDISFIKSFKKMNPKAKTIMYQWDSNKTNNFGHVLDEFDNIFSFDYEDCENFNIHYLPLFYTNDIAEINNKQSIVEYDFFLMGTYIPERYEALIKLKNYLKTTNYTLKSHIYIPVTSLLKEILLNKAKIDLNIVSTRHLARNEYLKLLLTSKIVVDISNNNQTGMAMRVIEALALGKKVMTSNKNIIKEPFYNANDILIFDTNYPNIPESFVKTDFTGLPNILPINKWLKTIFRILE